MAKDPAFLSAFFVRKRFAKYIMNNWTMNDHSLQNISCVYIILACDIHTKSVDIVYIGSTTQLFNRYKSHKIPEKVQSLGLINILYFKKMDFGFYDYERKLINRLKPIFNKQHAKSIIHG